LNNKIVRRICAILVGLALLVIIAGAPSIYSDSNSKEQTQIKTIDVSGTGIVSMAPDEATVYLGAQTQSANAITAQKDNAIKMDKVINALQDAGIAKADMKTSSYTMYPVRDQKGENITGYIVSNQLKVTIKEINKTGDIIDKAVKAGANQVYSISFTLADETQQKAREQALKNAAKAARSDADILASELGVVITGPLQVSTGGGTVTTPYSAATIEKSVTTPINPGDVTVSAYVSVKYQFK
jgi:uncharacterized protein